MGQRKCQDSLHNDLQQECEADKGAKVYWLYNPSLSYMTGELLCIYVHVMATHVQTAAGLVKYTRVIATEH